MTLAAPSRAPYVTLRPYRTSQGRLIDPVVPEVAALVDRGVARSLQVLPFDATEDVVFVAAVAPQRQEVRSLVKTLGSEVRLCRADARELSEAQDRVDGNFGRFGQIAVAMGRLRPLALRAALAQQARQGGRIGQILIDRGTLSSLDVAQVIARQSGRPFVDLFSGRSRREGLETAWDMMPENFWRSRAVVPVDRAGPRLVLAAEDPGEPSLAADLERIFTGEVRIYQTGQRDVQAALRQHYGQEYLDLSRTDLLRVRPEDSAHQLLSRGQKTFFAVLGGLLALCLMRFTGQTMIVLNALSQLGYIALTIFKLSIFRAPASRRVETVVTPEELAQLDDSSLPPYTVFVPLRSEASVLPVLLRALRMLDYPKDRLDVKLLLEEDDPETIAAVSRTRLPGYIDVVVLPAADPRTKPKACNYGLLSARGTYVVIYDAEDIPDPLQLKKAIVAFRKAGPEVGCVQAKLSFFNKEQNLLTRWFTTEYAMWFGLLLPGLQVSRMPIPLGGTSNHLRTDVLQEIGAWDPYNVTEDADLGVRLYKAGYRTVIVDSDTLEEANSDFVNWVRQRSRWVKGYIQTWLVHMRHPVRLWRELGPRGFLGFQAMVAGTPFTFLMNPLYWVMTTMWFLVAWGLVQQVFPSWLYYMGMGNLLLGNFMFAYLNMVAAYRRGDDELVKYAVFAPLYWGLMSVAAAKALIQIVSRPSHWEKTVHGLADVEMETHVA
jgi:cellulose synthase/poly-beta-1,6-N-acetylglucosamine synthase-like glycosyltransferase